MDHPSFGVPFVLPLELDHIALAKAGNSRSQIDVMGNQDCLTGIQADDKALVATAVVVIREDLAYQAFAMNLNVARMIFKSAGQNGVISCKVRGG